MHAFSTRAAKSIHALVNQVALPLVSSANQCIAQLVLSHSSSPLCFLRAKASCAPFFPAAKAKPVRINQSSAVKFDKLERHFFPNFPAPLFCLNFGPLRPYINHPSATSSWTLIYPSYSSLRWTPMKPWTTPQRARPWPGSGRSWRSRWSRRRTRARASRPRALGEAAHRST